MFSKKSIYQRFIGKGIFPYQMAFTLLIPIRNIFLSAQTLINRLELKDNHTVLEIGPGPGYFSIDMAKFLSHGILYLFDIQQEMLDYARRRLEKRKCFNVKYYRADLKTFPFSNNFFDRIFMVTVLGEIENCDVYIREIARTLKDDGIVSVSEMAGDPDKMKDSEVKVLFDTVGLECYKEYKTLWGYTLNFKKREVKEYGEHN